MTDVLSLIEDPQFAEGSTMCENAMKVSVSCLMYSSNCEHLIDTLPLVLRFEVASNRRN